MVEAATSSDGDGPPRPSDEVLEAVRGAEVYFGFGVPRVLLVAAPNLRWVHSAAAGVGRPLSDARQRCGIHELGVHAIRWRIRGGRRAPLSARTRHAADQQHRTEWNKTPFVPSTRCFARWTRAGAIVGTGGIGQAVGERLTALALVAPGSTTAGAGSAARVRAGGVAGRARRGAVAHDVIVLRARRTPLAY
jgi:phosphoglycerate dehydrogenase-like enzyme